MKTFIHHDGALGDALLSLPCIREIRKSAGLLCMAGRPDVAGLLKQMGLVDEAYSADNALYASLYTAAADEQAERFLTPFDRAFLFTVRKDSSFGIHLRRIVPETGSILTIPPAGEKIHATDYRMRQLAPDRNPATAPVMMEVPLKYREQAQRLLTDAGCKDGEQRLTVIHPGSGGRKKCWPLERYLRLADRLLGEQDTFLAVLSGPAEDYGMRERIEQFVRSRHNTVHLRDRELSLVAAILSMAGLYVGNDSGITHLAAAVGAPVIALFGPTDPRVWGPKGAKVRVLAAASLGHATASISVDEVLSNVEGTGQRAKGRGTTPDEIQN